MLVRDRVSTVIHIAEPLICFVAVTLTYLRVQDIAQVCRKDSFSFVGESSEFIELGFGKFFWTNLRGRGVTACV